MQILMNIVNEPKSNN